MWAWLVLVVILGSTQPSSAAATSGLQVRTLAGTFSPSGHLAAAPAWYMDQARPLTPGGERHLVAIADRPLGPDERGRLEASGARLTGYLPDRAYLVRVAPSDEPAVLALPFVMWLGALPPHLKVHPELASRAAEAIAAKGSADASPVSLRVVLHEQEPDTRVQQILSGLPVTATPSGHGGAWRVQSGVPVGDLPAVLSALAGLPEVEAVEPARMARWGNQDAVWVHQSFVGPSPQQTPLFDRGIFGCGQIVGLADSGLDYGACHFSDPNGPPPISLCLSAPCPAAAPTLTRRKTILYYNWSGTPTGDDDTCGGILGASGHGTHTSGSVTGDRTPFADCASFTTPARTSGDGQAPGAKLVMQEMGDGLEYLNSLGGSMWNLADVAFQTGVRIQSHSWGGGCQDILGECIPGCELTYDSFARDADLAMWSHPDMLLTSSAGNAGELCLAPQAVTTPAIAKNILSVGSVGHGASAGVASSFSSQGPTLDGRLKPTLAAQGEAVVSAASDASGSSANCSTCSLEGTSMSAPTVAGLAALVREYFTAGYHAAGARSPGQGIVPTGALIKAVLVDGAVPLTPGTPPDFQTGFGRALLSHSLPFTGSAFQLRFVDNREGVLTGEVVTRAYDVAAGTPLRATLVWTDFPAALNAAVARVNEMRLEVTDPSGAVWFQTLDAGTEAPIQTSDPNAPHDPLNVEHRLVFPTPAAGRWIVRVIAEDVPMGPQPFALVVRGALTDCPAPAAPASPSLGTPADNQVQVSWSAVPGAVAYHVQRSLGSCPAGPWKTVAAGLTGTSFLDSGMAGGTTWSYRVVAASGTVGECESAPSPCASVVPTGDCFLAPAFAGLGSAVSAGTSGCAIQLSWPAASGICGSDVRYNIYRSPTPGFTPGPANRIARCVAGTSYVDADSVPDHVTQHYIVRAEDATTGHGGPCRGGNEDVNLHTVSAAADGPPALGTFLDDAGDTGGATFGAASSWSVADTGGHTAPHAYVGTSSSGICAPLVSPILTLAGPETGPQLLFDTVHELLYDPFGFFGAEGSLGQVEIATGPAFSNWTRVPLTPDYPAVVEFPFNNCATTANIDTYFSDFNTTYTTYTASLTNWAGEEVRLRFLLVGDLIYPTGTWTLDDIRITQAVVPGSCTPLASGPPPIPDGASVPGQPLTVQRAGNDLLLTWDAATCPAAAVNVYWGNIGSYGSFAGGFCDLPPTGSATVSLPGDVWMIVVATDGSSTDGSHSRTGAGAELTYAGASAVCPAITSHVTNGGCP
ncbi:MAG: S8 family serine peptidase [Candidatus Polarisedimenticolia bacterium]